jgi:hypothetical protein
MSSYITIHLFGSLRKQTNGKIESPMKYKLKDSIPLKTIIKDLKIVKDRLQLVMINHRAARIDSIVCPGDRLALFPLEYPIFADWKNLRSN